tara:strand:- start:189 stop:446 length:258 start_codon:yes stop_codon:yes gene_type:complete
MVLIIHEFTGTIVITTVATPKGTPQVRAVDKNIIVLAITEAKDAFLICVHAFLRILILSEVILSLNSILCSAEFILPKNSLRKLA